MTNHTPLRFAVIGNPVAHSLSPWIHQYFAQKTGISLVYDKILAEPETFAATVDTFFREGGKGLNITSPFKEQAFALADKHTTRCSQAKSANVLWLCSEGLCADNTDGAGLIEDLSQYIQLSGSSIAILGAGGATRGILESLLSSKPQSITVINRTLARAAALQTHFPQIIIHTLNDMEKKRAEPFDLLIHATSAHLKNQTLAIPASLFNPATFCYDLTYQLQKPTAFVSLAKAHNCRSVDGLGMLIEQAAEAFRLWHEVPLVVDKSVMRKKMRNSL